MAFSKSIALEEAARLVGQRKLAQAVRQYLAIAAEDPGDFTLLNTIGDLCVRDGNIPEALRQFYKLAEHYEREGFFLRAIAIYKKIAKLDTNSADALVKLGELYKSQGLSHEAREQYAQALAICHRNGLPDKALQILNQLIAQEPDNAGYRAQLAETCEAAGKTQEAFEHYVQAASLAHRHRNFALAEAALMKAAQGDPNHPEVLLLKEKLAAEQEPPGLIESAIESSPALDQENPADAVEPDVESEAEPEAEVSPPVQETGPETGLPEISPSPGSVEIDFSAEWQAFAPAPPPPEVSATETDWEGELAEVRFYLDHGFSSEAIRTLETLEEKYPRHPQLAELRLRAEEMEVAKIAPPEPELPSSTPEPEADFASDGAGGPQAAPEEPEIESGFTPAALAAPELALLMPERHAPEIIEAPPQEPVLADPEISLPEGAVEGRNVPRIESAPQEKVVREDVAFPLEKGFGAPQMVQPVLPSSPLRGTLSARSESDIMSPLFEGVLRDLESDPEVDPSRETPQAHYNLGVAFREMGLAEEAIGEFQKAVKGAGTGNYPPHFVDACSLLGLCFMEKRMPGIAARWFLRALGAPGLDEETHLGLTYDLAVAYEQSGNFEAALERFSEVYSVNIDYREIADKVRALQQKRS